MDRVFGVALLLVAASVSAQTRCAAFLSPFSSPESRAIASITKRISGRFGDYRASYVKGHKHSGVELDGRYEEPVFAVCEGVVVDVHLEFPHRTIVIEHVAPDGTKIFASYKHLEEVTVKEGSLVSATTRLGRLFSAAEHKRSGFPHNHLHLEIRRSFDDGGAASWTTMTRERLDATFYDPLRFFRLET